MSAFKISVLLFFISFLHAQAEILCVLCNATYITLTVERSDVRPSEVNLTAVLRFFEIPAEKDPMQIIEYARAGKINPERLAKITTAGPVVGENVTFVFNISFHRIIDHTVQTFGEEKVLGTVLTDENGTARLSTKIEGVQGCGTIIARFKGIPNLLPTETSTLYCVGGVVPFAALLAIEPWKCVALFLFLGLLVAGLYATGRRPLAAFDITTPKPPKPYEYPGYKYKRIGVTGIIAATLPGYYYAGRAIKAVRELVKAQPAAREEAARAWTERWIPWKRESLARTLLVKYVIEPKVIESFERKAKAIDAQIRAYAALPLSRELRARMAALASDLARYERTLSELKFLRDIYVRKEAAPLRACAVEYARQRGMEALAAVRVAIDGVYDQKVLKRIAKGAIVMPAAQLESIAHDVLALTALRIAEGEAARMLPEEWHAVVSCAKPPYFVARGADESQSEARARELLAALRRVAGHFVRVWSKRLEQLATAKHEVKKIDEKLIRALQRRDAATTREQRKAAHLTAAVHYERKDRREQVIAEEARNIISALPDATETERRLLAAWVIAEAIEQIDDTTFNALRTNLSKELSAQRERAILSGIPEKIIQQPERLPERIAEMSRSEIIELFHKLLIERAIEKVEEERWIFGKIAPVFEKVKV